MTYRLTKYNPAFRDMHGTYTQDEWTSISDIGRVYSGITFSAEDYMRTESSYVRALLSFCSQCHLEGLAVDSLEMSRPSWAMVHACELNTQGVTPIDRTLDLSDGVFIPTTSLEAVIRSILREEIWCRLAGPFGSYIHFGYDYYTYVGSDKLTDSSFMQEPLLFIERFESPYKLSAIER